MMTQPENISVTAPFGPAMSHAKRMLFAPFDLNKWFTIGFCAWLAFLGEAGGAHFNFPGGTGQSGQNVHHRFDQARDYVTHNLSWLVPLAAAVIVVIFGLGLLCVWLNCRGKFMFLHCVALNRAEIAVPWNKFAREAQSLFLFRIVLGLIGTIAMLPFLGIAILVIYGMAIQNSWNAGGILGLVALGFALLLIALVFAVIGKFTKDFAVPIMFLRGKRCLEAWKELRPLIVANAGEFALYLLFQIVLNFGIVLVTLLLVIVTCCIAGCLLALPYIGTVLLLPVLIFSRAYSLYYFAQYGPEYNVFPPATPPPAPGIPPVAA